MSDHEITEGTDPAQWNSASESTDIAAELDAMLDQIKDMALPSQLTNQSAQAIMLWHKAGITAAVSEATADALRLIAAALWCKGDANIRLAALAFVGGLDVTQGKSMAHFAKECKCSRAAISKEANAWADRLNIRSNLMKSEKARDTYSRRQAAVSKKRHSESSP